MQFFHFSKYISTSLSFDGCVDSIEVCFIRSLHYYWLNGKRYSREYLCPQFLYTFLVISLGQIPNSGISACDVYRYTFLFTSLPKLVLAFLTFYYVLLRFEFL